jgi:beta-galactosidase
VGSQYGVIDICGFPKDAFYYYKAWWSSEPVLHLFPHWNWPGREGQPIEVWAYTNCEEVELALNGQALGRRKVETATHVSWTVPYAPGTLTARGWRGGKLVLTATVETTGAPAAVRLLPDRATIKADGEDLSMVTVQVVDRQGRVVPTAENEIIYTALGAGKILGVGSGHPSSHESDKSDRRRVFNGHCQVIVQAARESGGIQLEAVSAGLEGGVARIKTEPCEPRQAVFAVSAAATGFACSSLQPAPDDIHDATPPVAGTAFHKVTTVRADGFCDIREFHKRRDGFVLIRATFVMENAGTGVLLYGADGPVRVWVNGTAVDCRPEARNPAVKDGFKVDVAWKAGENVALFGLQTNGGKAWGVFARALPAASSKK